MAVVSTWSLVTVQLDLVATLPFQQEAQVALLGEILN
jgi:hypothetical protein